MSAGHGIIVWRIVLLNSLGVLVYFISGIILFSMRRKKALAGFAEGEATTEDMERIDGIRNHGTDRVMQTALICLVCPVAGAAFFLMSLLLQKLLMRKPVDLRNGLFSKDKHQQVVAANVETEQDLVPLEEALTLADDRNRRKIVLGVVKEDASTSLDALLHALNNDDSETAHYAASVLSDVLNDFRANVQKMSNQLEEYRAKPARKPKAIATCARMLDYMIPYLKQHVFADFEQTGFVDTMEEAARYLWDNARDELKPDHFENVVQLLLDEGEEDKCAFWCDAVTETFPNDLVSYRCCLNYYFQTEKKEQFFDKINRLRSSGIMLDPETLSVIRTFSGAAAKA